MVLSLHQCPFDEVRGHYLTVLPRCTDTLWLGHRKIVPRATHTVCVSLCAILLDLCEKLLELIPLLDSSVVYWAQELYVYINVRYDIVIYSDKSHFFDESRKLIQLWPGRYNITAPSCGCNPTSLSHLGNHSFFRGLGIAVSGGWRHGRLARRRHGRFTSGWWHGRLADRWDGRLADRWDGRLARRRHGRFWRHDENSLGYLSDGKFPRVFPSLPSRRTWKSSHAWKMRSSEQSSPRKNKSRTALFPLPIFSSFSRKKSHQKCKKSSHALNSKHYSAQTLRHRGGFSPTKWLPFSGVRIYQKTRARLFFLGTCGCGVGRLPSVTTSQHRMMFFSFIFFSSSQRGWWMTGMQPTRAFRRHFWVRNNFLQAPEQRKFLQSGRAWKFSAMCWGRADDLSLTFCTPEHF